MWFSSWLRKRTSSPNRRPANRFRPGLEVLEDRAVPATFLVNTPLDVLGHDNGMLSLRQAIIDANATPKTADTIVLPAGNYALTQAGAGEDSGLTGDLDIKGPLTINGAGAGSTVVDAAGLDRVFQVFNGPVTLSGMTIQGGNAVIAGSGDYRGTGGGIANLATLTVSDCIISGNTALTIGGGIYNLGTLTVNNSVISANSALSNGGGIYNQGSLTVNNSLLSANSAAYSGGGIYNQATLTISSGSALSGNSAHNGSGGGIFNANTGTLTVSNSTLSGNSAHVAGGGIANFSSRKATVQYTTLSDNTASSGGGICNNVNTTMTVNYCTLSNNSAGGYGGGITNAGTLTVRNSTLLGNFAPLGADLYNVGVLNLSGSIIGVMFP